MPTLTNTIAAFVASRDFDRATLARLAFWEESLGSRDLAEITADDVDLALVRLTERGRLVPRRGKPTEPAGSPLSGATVNRYVTQLSTVFKYARRLRLLHRTHVPPTRGIGKAPEVPDPNRYLRAEEVERILAAIRQVDTRWGKLEALVLVAFHTGLRLGNLMTLRWGDVDLEQRTIAVAKTKNGFAQVSVLSERAADALRELPGQETDALVFEGRKGHPFGFRRLWVRVCTEAGLPGRNFHQLRHACGHALATAGVNQASIMAVMGHRTLRGSSRYMHADTGDKRRVVDQVFR